MGISEESWAGMQVQAQGSHRNEERIDVDGLPHVGAVVYPGQGYYSKVDCATGALYWAVHGSRLQWLFGRHVWAAMWSSDFG